MSKRLTYIVFYVVVACTDPCSAQDSIRHYSGPKFNADYSLSGTMLDGKYVSYYKNGKKKAVGRFACNNRVEWWSVYDSTGKLKTERYYTNNFEYLRTFPYYPEGPAKLLGKPLYIPSRDSNGCYKWYFIQERAIMWSKRTWGYLYLKDNPILDTGKLFNVIYSAISAHKIHAYKFNDADYDKTFLDTLSTTAASIDTNSVKVIGYLIKGDWFTDIDRLEMEYEVIGICPLIARLPFVNDSKNEAYLKANDGRQYSDTIPLFWIYYPQLRPSLGKVKLHAPKEAPYIKNLDDVFFTRYYNNVFGCESGINGPIPVKDRDELMLNMLELEHDCWIGEFEN